MRKLTFLLISCLFLFSCRKGFEELNMNPNVVMDEQLDAGTSEYQRDIFRR